MCSRQSVWQAEGHVILMMLMMGSPSCPTQQGCTAEQEQSRRGSALPGAHQRPVTGAPAWAYGLMGPHALVLLAIGNCCSCCCCW